MDIYVQSNRVKQHRPWCLNSYFESQLNIFRQKFTNLPQIKSNCTDVAVSIQKLVWRVCRVVDLRVDPSSLECRIRNLLWFPFALKIETNRCYSMNRVPRRYRNKNNFDEIKKNIEHLHRPCNLGCRSSSAPIPHPSRRPNRPACWHLDLECVPVVPNLPVSYLLGRRSFHHRPNLQASSRWDPEVNNITVTTNTFQRARLGHLKQVCDVRHEARVGWLLPR